MTPVPPPRVFTPGRGVGGGGYADGVAERSGVAVGDAAEVAVEAGVAVGEAGWSEGCGVSDAEMAVAASVGVAIGRGETTTGVAEARGVGVTRATVRASRPELTTEKPSRASHPKKSQLASLPGQRGLAALTGPELLVCSVLLIG
jgi:hypothetical protein